jgi:hypothetical protein
MGAGLAMLVAVGCGDEGPGPGAGGPGPSGEQPAGARWAVGFYFAPERVSDDFDSPPQGFIFEEDGTWTHSSWGSVDDGRAVGCDGVLDDGTQVCMVLCSDVGVTGGTCPGQTTCVALPGGDGVCLW